MILGFLWSAIKEIKAPFTFDVEHGIVLHAVQGNRASSRGKGDVSWFSSSCGRNLGYILELRRGGPFRHVFVQRRQDSCLGARDTSGFSSSLGMAIGSRLHVRRETHGPFPRATGILGLLSIFKRSQASSPLEALISADLSVCKGCEAAGRDEAED